MSVFRSGFRAGFLSAPPTADSAPKINRFEIGRGAIRESRKRARRPIGQIRQGFVTIESAVGLTLAGMAVRGAIKTNSVQGLGFFRAFSGARGGRGGRVSAGGKFGLGRKVFSRGGDCAIVCATTRAWKIN